MLDVLAYVLFGLFLLMVPGFLFTLVLYPRKESLDFWQRMGVSLGLGVLVLIYLGFVLAQPGLKMLTLAPFVLAVFGVCLLFALIAYWRGGLEVAIIYERALMRKISKLRQPKPVPPEEKPIPLKLPPSSKEPPTPPEEKPAPPPEERPAPPEEQPAQPPQPPEEKQGGESV
ncbi:MAG: hypothetical protein AVW05_04280 [Hadesarchaea archaeon DG-33]|nr:MAG: hypothetical protein AVW05_04280 [Hadesarchaea archaeon DG-33]